MKKSKIKNHNDNTHKSKEPELTNQIRLTKNEKRKKKKKLVIFWFVYFIVQFLRWLKCIHFRGLKLKNYARWKKNGPLFSFVNFLKCQYLHNRINWMYGLVKNHGHKNKGFFIFPFISGKVCLLDPE